MRTSVSRQYRRGAAWALLVVLSITGPAAAQDSPDTPERITWQKAPIPVELSVGRERRVDFPCPVKVGLPAAVQAAGLRVQSVAGSVYLLAHQPFGPARVMVRSLAGSRVYLLDLSAKDKRDPGAPVQILDPEAEEQPPQAGDSKQPTAFPYYGYVALTRFAAQQPTWSRSPRCGASSAPG